VLDTRLRAESAARTRHLGRMLTKVREAPKPSAKSIADRQQQVMPAPEIEIAILALGLHEFRTVAERISDLEGVRCVLTPFAPSGAASALAAEGILVLTGDLAQLKGLDGQRAITIPAPSAWGPTIAVTAGKTKLELAWNVKGVESSWVALGHLFRGAGAVPPPRPSKTRR